MPEDNPSQESLARISERLDDIETTLREQLARTHVLEQRLGLAPAPVTHSPKQTVTTMVVEPERPLTREPDRDLETLIGGTWFNRIGIVALIFAVGYLLREVFSRGLIGPQGQVLIGVAMGIGLLIAGECIRARGYRNYAQGLSGGGIAVLYLAFYAAFARYGLIGQSPAFLLMSLVTATTVLLASRYDALAIAILGSIGGFLTPILLSTGHDSEAGLFTYIALLDAGVLALAYFRQWRAIDYLSFGATILIAAWWMVQWYSRERLWLTIFFFTLFFLIFAVLSILHHVVNRLPARPLDVGLIFTNALIYFATCYLLLETNYHPYLGLFAVFMSAFYLGLGYFTYTRGRGDRLLISTFIALAATFITLAVPIQLDLHWVTIGWAIYGGVMLVAGIWRSNRVLRIMALGLLALTIGKVFLIDLASLDKIYRIASFVVLGAILLAVSFLYQQRQRRWPET